MFVHWYMQSQYHNLPIEVYTDSRMVVDTARGGVKFQTCDDLPLFPRKLGTLVAEHSTFPVAARLDTLLTLETSSPIRLQDWRP